MEDETLEDMYNVPPKIQHSLIFHPIEKKEKEFFQHFITSGFISLHFSAVTGKILECIFSHGMHFSSLPE